MKKKQKVLLLMAATALGSVLCGGVSLNQSVRAQNAEIFAMEKGASVRISTDKAQAGIRFTAGIGEVDENAEYGMLIVRNDWLNSWGITDDFVPQVEAKFNSLAVNKDENPENDVPAPVKKATPFQDEEDGNKWKIRGSLIGVLEDNYDQEFFGIAYKKVDGAYEYAALGNAGDNVRSIADVALGAMVDDTEDKNNTEEAQTCFEVYTGDAKRVKNAELTVEDVNADKDLTFEIKATESFKEANTAIDFAITGDKNASLNLNTESEMDGEFIVESEAMGDGWYTVTVNGDLYEAGDTLAITVADQLVMKNLAWKAHSNYAITADTALSLLTPKTVDNKTHEFKTAQALNVNASGKAWTIESANGAVVSASGNTVNAVGSGDTTVTVKSRFATSAAIPVRVSYPISSASELDFLAMVTYTHSKANAEKYLGANYLFTNNIDYSTHERNYILPIASVNHEHGRYQWSSTANAWIQAEDQDNGMFAMGGLTRGTYYSIGWKDVLGLTEATMVVDGTSVDAWYMKNSDKAGYAEDVIGEEFRGINPNGLAFKGRMDGNGYAIQNAFYMADNMQGQALNPGSTAYGGVGGFFVGYNIGTIENLEMYASVASAVYYYNNGKYSSSNNGTSSTFKQLYNVEGTSKQKVLLGSNWKNESNHYWANFTASYAPHRGGQGMGATGIVGLNNGVLQNLYHKVNVYAPVQEKIMSAQGVIASINGYKITNCVVDKYDNASETGETTLATKTLNSRAGISGARQNRYDLVGTIQGSQITGCYSIMERGSLGTIAASPKALTYDSTTSYFGGEIDELSSMIFSTINESNTNKWTKNKVAMYQAYQANNNLNTVIWNITENAASISLNDGLVSVR